MFCTFRVQYIYSRLAGLMPTLTICDRFGIFSDFKYLRHLTIIGRVVEEVTSGTAEAMGVLTKMRRLWRYPDILLLFSTAARIVLPFLRTSGEILYSTTISPILVRTSGEYWRGASCVGCRKPFCQWISLYSHEYLKHVFRMPLHLLSSQALAQLLEKAGGRDEAVSLWSSAEIWS